MLSVLPTALAMRTGPGGNHKSFSDRELSRFWAVAAFGSVPAAFKSHFDTRLAQLPGEQHCLGRKNIRNARR